MHRLSNINLAKYLAVLLRPFVGQSEYQMKNSETFVQRKLSITLQGTDILVSFDVASVFTKIPLKNTITNTSTEISQAECKFHETCPNNNLFSSCRLFYQQKGEVSMQCFSTLVRQRPGKFFFYKTRARSQQIYS